MNWTRRPLQAITTMALAACTPAAAQTCSWDPIGAGLGTNTGEVVEALAWFDSDGPGPSSKRLYAGGYWDGGSTTHPTLAEWDGTDWNDFGPTTGSVKALAPIKASGPIARGLYVGGGFPGVPGVASNHIVHWDGNAWHSLALWPGKHLGGSVHAIAAWDPDGPGPLQARLYIGGKWWVTPGGTSAHFASWDGVAWTEIGGLQPASFGLLGVGHIVVFDEDGLGPQPPSLFVSGQMAGGVLRWDGAAWSQLGPGLQNGGAPCDWITSMAVLDPDGAGPQVPALYVAGRFDAAGATPLKAVARWDGVEWSLAWPNLFTAPDALAVFDSDGNGPESPRIIAAGGQLAAMTSGGLVIDYVLSFDGAEWTPLDSGMDWSVLALASGDLAGVSDNALIAGGLFTSAGGAVALRVASFTCDACYADCDVSTGIGVLDVFDFLCFQNSFVNGETYACDCDTSTGLGVCDVFDFLCFQNAFVGGCP